MQAELRMQAAKEIKAHPERYPAALPDADGFAKKVTKAGEWAESMALMALARACRVEIRIFAKSSSGWHLYQLKPAKRPSRVTWLVLEDEHYRWCKPKGRIKDEVLRGAVVCDDTNGISDITETVKFSKGDASQAGAAKRELSPTADEGATSKKTKAEQSDDMQANAEEPLRKGGGGRGGPGSDAGSARSAARSSSQKTVGSKRARQMMGLRSDEGSSSDPDLEEEYHGGEIFRCPCGWAPATGLKEEKRRAANRHWQICTGTRPTKLSKPVLKDMRRRSTWRKRRWAPADARAAAAGRKFEELLATAPAQVAAAACQPNFDTPSTRAITGLNFTCSRCFRTAPMARLRNLPCKARSEDMSIEK